MSPSQRYAQMAQDLRSSVPSTCRWLDPEEVNIVGTSPIDAGGFADVYKATHGGRKVVLKSYRCYATFDVAQVAMRFRDEARVWTLLCHGGVDVVSLVGVYSTEAHPFGLVYEYMDGLNVQQYLGNVLSGSRLKLLTVVARSLSRVHDLGIVHGNLKLTNILVDRDGVARIAGLGNASILPHSAGWTAEGGTNVDRLSPIPAELTWPGASPSQANVTHPAKADDVYSFGAIAWEVLTGQQPFFGMTEVAATYSMLSGARPPRPNRHEISDRVWGMIELCWDGEPSGRISIGEAVSILETELRCAPSSHTLSRAW